MEGFPWWAKTTVYHIYPRSFQDSNGDGIGDLRGIISRLDYLRELGVESIWISPFFASPQRDHGYDISNYLEIAPEYGTMEDVRELIKHVHKRNMKIIFDMVLNHTSDQHPWFQESRSSLHNPKRNWYVWRDGKIPDGKKPPNNWKSLLGQKAWKYDRATDQWYNYHFFDFQPDLNYHNPEVRREIFRMLCHWLDLGVDGFRLDIIHSIFTDPLYRDNPFSFLLIPSDKYPDSFLQRRIYDVNLPETFEFARDLRSTLENYQPDRFLVGEVFGRYSDIGRYYGEDGNGLNMSFVFQLASLPWRAKAYHGFIREVEKHIPYPRVPALAQSNHDRTRMYSRLKARPDRVRLAALLQFTLRGVPFVYYGEEIGMENLFISGQDSEDPLARVFDWIPRWLEKLLGVSVSRDRYRTPMQWNAEPGAGFSPPNTKAWRPIHPNHRERNVDNLRSNLQSLWHYYRELISLRRHWSALHSGTQSLPPLRGKHKIPRSCLVFFRRFQDQQLIILANFSKRPKMVVLPGVRARAVFSTGGRPRPITLEERFPLEGHQAWVFENRDGSRDE